MRKVIFINTFDEVKKLMIYESEEGVYLFGYDCVQDTVSIWDNWYLTLEEAKDYCEEIYQADKEKWINISEPLNDCQHDFIMPTKIVGKENGNPQWGHFQTLQNGKWVDNNYPEKYLNFGAMTGNERLWVSGLFDEFEKSKITDKPKARQILTALQFDLNSINSIV